MEYIEIDFDNMCRLCACTDSEALVPIFESYGLELHTQINEYLPIKVGVADELPLHICSKCKDVLIAFDQLYQCCLEAKLRFEHMLGADEVASNEAEVGESTFGLDDGAVSMVTSDITTSTTANVNPIQPAAVTINEYTLDEPLSSTDDVPLIDGAPSASFIVVPISDFETAEIKVMESMHFDDTTVERSKQFDSLPAVTDNLSNIEQTINHTAKTTSVTVVNGRKCFRCEVCDKLLATERTLIAHRRIHTGDRPHSCHLCPKTFRISIGLHRHIRETHEKIRKYSCDVCDRRFTNQRNVNEHRRLHTEERPYKCDTCLKVFKQQASLFTHRRTHQTAFRFKCPHCSMGFNAMTPLNLHIATHTGEKPHACDICGRHFRVRYEMNKHKLTHSDVKPFVCIKCGLRFRQKRYLVKHCRTHHKDILEECLRSINITD